MGVDPVWCTDAKVAGWDRVSAEDECTSTGLGSSVAQGRDTKAHVGWARVATGHDCRLFPCPKGRGLVQPKILAVLGEFTGEENWSHRFWRRCFGWENLMERSWFNGDYGGERRKVKSQRFKNQNPRKIESDFSRNSDEIRSQGSSETSFWSSGTVTRGSRHCCRPKP